MRALVLSLLLLTAACSSVPAPPRVLPTLSPLPMQLLLREEAPAERELLLVVQQEDASLRWSLLEPLGMPVARQRMVDGRWQADGLLPPNAEARGLFVAILFALTPADRIAAHYGADGRQEAAGRRSLWQGDRRLWQIDYPGGDPRRFTLRGATGAQWQVRPLEAGQ